MSGVLKQASTNDLAASAPAWRALGAKASPAPPVDPEIARLQDEVVSLQRKIEENAAEHARALKQTREDAIAEAKLSFKRNEDTSRKRLESSLAEAHRSFETALTDLEALAPAMCETVLSNLLGESGCFDRSLLVAAISHQIAAIRRESLVYLAVSPLDFTDAGALEALCASQPALGVRTDAALASGECRIGLELGHVELSLAEYREAVMQRLREWCVR